jgi:membrane associated rhomboid family serine protease
MAADSPLLRFRLWRAGLPPALRLLLTINVGVGIGWLAFLILRLGGGVVDWLALSPAWALTRPWTLLTYAFFDPYGDLFGLLGFVFAVLWLNWLGRDFEEAHGPGRLLALYGLAALGGAAAAVALGYGLGGGWATRIYAGAWGPVAAVLCAMATLHPERSIGLLFLGVVPLRWVAVGFVVLDLAFVQDPTHLAGALLGVGFALATRGGVDLGAWLRPFTERRPKPAARAPRPSPRAEAGARPRRSVGEAVAPGAPPAGPRRERGPRQATQAEVDLILDKISERGMAALTPEERRILEEYSRRA